MVLAVLVHRLLLRSLLQPVLHRELCPLLLGLLHLVLVQRVLLYHELLRLLLGRGLLRLGRSPETC